MRALLAATQPVGPGAVTFIAFVIVALILGVIGSFAARRLSNPVSKYRLLYVALLLPVSVGAFALLSLVGFGGAVVDSIAPVDGSVATVLGTFVEVFAAGLVWIAGYLPTVRGLGEVRDVDLELRSAIRSMLRYVIGVSAIVTAAIVPLRYIQDVGSLPILGVGLVLVVGVFTFGSPWLIPLVRSTRTPTGEREERIDDLTDSAGLAVRDVMVLETDDEQTASTLVRGPPGYRRLFVSTTFLDVFEDATARALLAVEAARLQTYAFEVRMVSIVGGGIALAAAFVLGQYRWVALGVALVVVVGGFWTARREVRRADDIAADRVGAAEVASALREYADVHAMEPSRRRIPNPLSATVPLGDRIDRLD